MLTVGLTGGIGSGKSEVSRLLASYGALVVDADQVAREVVAPGTEGFALVREAFGPAAVAPDGGLDRAWLAQRVFSDPEARERLNAIVHPRVAERSAALAADAPPDAVLVYDVPLLVENRLTDDFDLVVVVDAPDDVRLARLVSGRGLGRDDALARMAAQASRDERLAAADVVIDNSGTLEALEEQVAELWEELRDRLA